jgi:hypothetical protein
MHDRTFSVTHGELLIPATRPAALRFGFTERFELNADALIGASQNN